MDRKCLSGTQSYGDAIKSTVDKTLDGVSAFLSSVCMPASQEFGLMLRDKVRTWRLNNIIQVIKKAEGKLIFEDDQLHLQSHPKVALSILDNASMVDDELLQEWWAGLFASSCTNDGKDDQNLIFVNILKDLTVFEVKLLSYCCVNCTKNIFPSKLIVANDDFRLSVHEIIRITGVEDIRRIDREIDHMVSLGLFSNSIVGVSGFIVNQEQMEAHVTPSALALNLYYKTNSVNVSPEEFWGASLKEFNDVNKSL